MSHEPGLAPRAGLRGFGSNKLANQANRAAGGGFKRNSHGYLFDRLAGHCLIFVLASGSGSQPQTPSCRLGRPKALQRSPEQTGYWSEHLCYSPIAVKPRLR